MLLATKPEIPGNTAFSVFFSMSIRNLLGEVFAFVVQQPPQSLSPQVSATSIKLPAVAGAAFAAATDATRMFLPATWLLKLMPVTGLAADLNTDAMRIAATASCLQWQPPGMPPV